MKSPNKTDLYEQIYSIVLAIPKGRATSYGAIAAALGMVSGARVVGYAMNKVHTSDKKIPAHRVVNSKGILTGKFHFETISSMQELLEKEKIIVQDDQIQNWEKVFWNPSLEL